MLIVFLGVYHFTKNLMLAQTMTFTWLVLSHFVRIAAIRFDEKVPMFVNKYLNWSIAVPILLQMIILYTPLSGFFQVVPLSWLHWLILITSFVVAVILAKSITKIIDKNLPLTERDY